MISDQDKQRIEETAKQYSKDMLFNNHPSIDWRASDFKAGAHSEHTIAYNKGWNDAIDQLLKKFEEEGLTGVFYKELQKMKK